MASFPSVRIEGGLLGSDLLDELVAGELPGQRPADYGLDGRRNFTAESRRRLCRRARLLGRLWAPAGTAAGGRSRHHPDS